MPEVFYIKETDDEGKEIYREVEQPPTAEITDDVVRTHPLYEKVLQESIKRRQTIKTLREQLKELDSEEPTNKESTAPAPTVENIPAAQPLNEDELVNRILRTITERETEQANKRKGLREIAAKHKLPEDALPILESSANPELTAEYLGRMSVSLSSAEGGESRAASPKDAVAAALAKLGLTES